MSNVTEQDRGEDFIESSSLTAEEIERAVEESLPKIESIETKWLQLKTEDVVGSLNQILVFSRNSEMS